jgi:hypothetical protein
MFCVNAIFMKAGLGLRMWRHIQEEISQGKVVTFCMSPHLICDGISYNIRAGISQISSK